MLKKAILVAAAAFAAVLLVSMAPEIRAQTKPGLMQKAPEAAPSEPQVQPGLSPKAKPEPSPKTKPPLTPRSAPPTLRERTAESVPKTPGQPLRQASDQAAQQAKVEKLTRQFETAADAAQRQIERRKAEFEKKQEATLQREASRARTELGKLRESAARTKARGKLEPERVVAPPRITGGFGALQSGNGVVVLGERFGSNRGAVHLLTVTSSMELEIDEWYDSGVGGKVPARAAVACLTGEVQVMTQKGERSNKRLFGVPQIYKSLPSEDVKVVRCGSDASDNFCNGAGDASSCLLVGRDTPSVGGGAIYGRHATCGLNAADDSGTDVYEIDLKRGWVLDNAHFVSAFEPGEASTNPPSGQLPAGFQDGAPYWKPRIGWTTSPADGVAYALHIGIRGPECTSH